VNWASILAAAKRAQAAYIEDAAEAKAAFKALGLEFIGQHEDVLHQAVLSRDAAGAIYLSISGTRFGEAHDIDLLDDVYLLPIHVGSGAVVAAGVYNGMAEFLAWVHANVPAGTVINIEGHSLGAERALLTPLFLPKAQIGSIHAFEAPQCASSEYRQSYADELAHAVHTVCGADVWYGWPPVSQYCHPASSVIWLTGTGYKLIKPSEWPGGLSMGDHSIGLVVSRLEALTKMPNAPDTAGPCPASSPSHPSPPA
jgi:hypothetical protein